MHGKQPTLDVYGKKLTVNNTHHLYFHNIAIFVYHIICLVTYKFPIIGSHYQGNRYFITFR